jgi:hypothetical protein
VSEKFDDLDDVQTRDRLQQGPIWSELVGRDYNGEAVKFQQKLRAALPESMRDTFDRYSELIVEEACAESEAAFTLGRAWERRIGGAR